MVTSIIIWPLSASWRPRLKRQPVSRPSNDHERHSRAGGAHTVQFDFNPLWLTTCLMEHDISDHNHSPIRICQWTELWALLEEDSGGLGQIPRDISNRSSMKWTASLKREHRPAPYNAIWLHSDSWLFFFVKRTKLEIMNCQHLI